MEDPASSTNDDSQALLDQSRAGSKEAMGMLLERHLPGLRSFVRLRLGAGLRALESESDLVQSVCLDLIQDLEHFEYQGEGQFRQWLYTAALNKIRNRQRYWAAAKRAPGAHPQSLDDESMLLVSYRALCTPSHHAIQREQVDRLEKAFDRLPEHYREVLTLSRIVGLPQDAIAEQMGRTPSSIRNLLSRALVKLSAELAILKQD